MTNMSERAVVTTDSWPLRVPPVLGSQLKGLPEAEPSVRPRVRSVAAEDLSGPSLIYPQFTQAPILEAYTARSSPAPVQAEEGVCDAETPELRPLASEPHGLNVSTPVGPQSAEAAELSAPPICQEWKTAEGPDAANREARPVQDPSLLPGLGGSVRELPDPIVAALHQAQLGKATTLQVPVPGINDARARTTLDVSELSPEPVAALPEFSGMTRALPRPAPAKAASLPIPAPNAVGEAARKPASGASALGADLSAERVPDFAGIAPVFDRAAPAQTQSPLPASSVTAAADLHPRPASGVPASKQGHLSPVAPALGLEFPTPALRSTGGLDSEMAPPAGFIPLEYYSHRTRGGIRLQPAALPPRPETRPPAFCLEADLQQPVPRQELRTPSPQHGRVIAMPSRSPAWSKVAIPKSAWHVLEAVAAGLILGVGIWTGISELRRPGQTEAVKQDASAQYAYSAPSAPSAASAPAANSSPPPARGPVEWVRKAVAERATVEWTDSFKTGMEAWGMPAKSWAPGWSRHRDGYVRTGELALFQPSQAYRDYRLEFFAQIEKKSMGWVVRAQDRKNYHAMKLTVIERGLRPVVEIVHYAVTGGKPGPKSEIPLTAMVHNDEAIHVAVEVKGKRVVTSLEGQEVDSWTDESLASGGVGFFSEAGEEARLYWMKVAANNDLLGRICARMAGVLAPASQTVAASRPGEPYFPGPVQPKEAVLAAAVGYVRNRRKQQWNS